MRTDITKSSAMVIDCKSVSRVYRWVVSAHVSFADAMEQGFEIRIAHPKKSEGAQHGMCYRK
jgi:hypothetical protein